MIVWKILKKLFDTSTRAIKTSAQILEKKVDSKMDNLRNSMIENTAVAQTDAKKQQENFKELKENYSKLSGNFVELQGNFDGIKTVLK